MKKKRKRLIFFVIFLFLCSFVLILPYMIVDINLIGDKNVVLDYGETYSESGYRAKLFEQNITDDIVVKSNLDEKIGKYEITYNYKFLFFNIKKTRYVEVKDISEPKLELIGGENFEVTVNEDYNEPGYKAMDNVDGDLTSSVVVSGTVDINTIGNYELVYTVTDSNGNEESVKRNVRVEKKRPTQMSISEYTLDGWYDEIKLKENVKDEEYFDSLVLVGDSNTMNMYLNGFLDGDNAWAIPCLHSESMISKEINLYGFNEKMKLLEAVEKYKPKTMMINFGTFSTTWIKEEVFVKNAKEVIEKINDISPDTEIVLISIYPILQYFDNVNKFDQATINKYNFIILEMAKEYDLKFLDVQSVLKGKDGYADPKYVISDGFYLTMAGHSLVKEYIKTHALGGIE